MSRRRIPVLALFALLVVAGGATFPMLENRLTAIDFAISGAESTRADEVVQQYLGASGAEQDLVVFQSDTRSADDPAFRADADRILADVATIPGVRRVIGPGERPDVQISADRQVAVGIVGIDGSADQRATTATEIQQRLDRSAPTTLSADVTGYSPLQNDAVVTESADVSRAELIGIPVALLVLILALGALAAAVLPVAVALAGMAIATGAMFALSTAIRFDSLTVSIATMIGIGVGIDYAMFIVSRFREELGDARASDRATVDAACGRALATAGATVAASGVIVMISLSSMIVLRAPMFRGIVLGVTIAVTSMLLVGLVALPALLSVLGGAVNRGALPRRFRPAELDRAHPGRSAWARWSRGVMRRPVLYGSIGIATLAAAATPLLGIAQGLDAGTAALTDMPSGRAAVALEGRFPPGTLAPITIVATGPGGSPMTTADRSAAVDYITRVSADERVAAVLPAEEADGRMAVPVLASAPFDSADALSLVNRLRDEARSAERQGGPTILVGGSTASFIDLGDEMSSRLPVVIGVVLVVTFVFLTFAFRSIVLPLKAIVMNLLATGAALGITVAVFQWGIGESILDFESPGFVQVYLPTIVFVVLFGLSMDYEVFLIGRIREYWLATGDNDESVAAGIGHTARPITAAAAIMVVVFASFVTAATLELKQVGFALAVAVAIDAIIVRMVLVPAFLTLMGHWNWWLPGRRARPTPTQLVDDSAVAS